MARDPLLTALVTLAFSLLGSTHTEAAVYRCDGPPVAYKVDMTPEEAAVKKCKEIGMPDSPVESELDAGPQKNWTATSFASGDGCRYFIDYSTVALRSGLKKAWFMESCDKPQEGNYGKDAYRSALFLKYVNCTEKTTFTAQIIRYPTLYGAGKPTESLQFPVRPEGFSDVAPNTLGAAWLRLVCAAK